MYRGSEAHKAAIAAWTKANPDRVKAIKERFKKAHPMDSHDRYLKRKALYPDRMKAWTERWRANNRDHIKEYGKANRKRQGKSVRAWEEKHPEDKILRQAVYRMMLYSDIKKDSQSRRYVGCSAGFLRGWLEAQFSEGMTWENYGAVWVVDHKVPLAWWDVANFPQHLYEASHYTNLQPMFKHDNIVKKDRFAG